SGKKLSEVAEVVIDDCVPAEDALVAIDGWRAPVAAGSTVAFITIAMAIVAELAARLAKRGIEPPVFVSPNVPGIPADNNARVFAAFEKAIRR
ncbi:MAG TPA: SIS domain-containing protein, partial [Thermoanaerobaculia bacterium]|nr:SIS domain-containing protein [Thermoanaerobaculia bacterium]